MCPGSSSTASVGVAALRTPLVPSLERAKGAPDKWSTCRKNRTLNHLHRSGAVAELTLRLRREHYPLWSPRQIKMKHVELIAGLPPDSAVATTTVADKATDNPPRSQKRDSLTKTDSSLADVRRGSLSNILSRRLQGRSRCISTTTREWPNGRSAWSFSSAPAAGCARPRRRRRSSRRPGAFSSRRATCASSPGSGRIRSAARCGSASSRRSAPTCCPRQRRRSRATIRTSRSTGVRTAPAGW